MMQVRNLSYHYKGCPEGFCKQTVYFQSRIISSNRGRRHTVHAKPWISFGDKQGNSLVQVFSGGFPGYFAVHGSTGSSDLQEVFFSVGLNLKSNFVKLRITNTHAPESRGNPGWERHF